MPEDPTNADRQRRYRERQAGRLPAITSCTTCGKTVNGPHVPYCSRCWLKTDAGRQWQRERMAAYRAKQRATS